MLLPKEAYIEFQEIYQKKYGVTLSLDEAVTHGDKLFRFLQRIHKSNLKEYHHSNGKKETKNHHLLS